jgi:hypothetical protein
MKLLVGSGDGLLAVAEAIIALFSMHEEQKLETKEP